MGVRLIVEVLDHWYDAGLTAGERDDLIVLAENANESTRLTWGPVHAPYILKRANKSAASWKNSVGKLLRKKALTTHVPGRIGQVAVYHLTPLCPDPPHDGYQGFCTRPERVTSQMTHSVESSEEGHLSDDPEGHLSDDPKAQEGHLTDVERVTGEVTPTPLFPSSKSPSNTPSSSVAEVSAVTLASESGTEGGGGGDPFHGKTSKAEAFVDALDYRGRTPSRSQRDKLSSLVAAALAAGWTEHDLKVYLDLGGAAVKSAAALYLHRLGQDELPEPPRPLAAVRSLLPPACSACLEEHPGAQTNLRLRLRDGQPCPECHPGSESVQQRQPLQATGTDATVAGWLSLAADLTEREAMLNSPMPRPSTTDQRVQQAIDAGKRLQAQHDAQSGQRRGQWPTPVNGVWERLGDEAANGLRPDGADKIPHCGECDEYTRTRGDDYSLCPKCHPAMRF